MTSMAAVCEQAAANPVAAGHTPASIRQVWASLSKYVQQCIFQKKSVIIPGFVQFVLQHQEVHSGTWNVRRSWIPQVVVDPAFVSQYGVSNAIPFNAGHHSAQTPILLNGVLLAELSGLSRDAAMSAVKATVRAIGHQVETYVKDLIAIEVSGIAVLEFQNRRLCVRWAPAFLKAFEEHAGVSTDYVPKPPSLLGSASGRNGTSGATGEAARQPLAPAAAAIAARPSADILPDLSAQRPPSRAVTPRGGSECSPSVSPRLSPRDRLRETLSSLSSVPSDYERRNLTKTAYRRMRMAEDTELWQKMMDANAKARGARVVAERQQREQEGLRLAEMARNEHLEVLAKKEAERGIAKVNATLLANREAPLPKAFPAVDMILLHRPPNNPINHDVATLEKQVREQLVSQQKEREKVVVTGKVLTADYHKMLQEQEALVLKKKQAQEVFNKALTEQVAASTVAKQEELANYKKPASPLLHFKDNTQKLQTRKAALNAQRAQLAKDLNEKVKTAEEQEAIRIRDEAAALANNKTLNLKYFDESKASKTQAQKELAATLKRQMQDKYRVAEAERSARAVYIDKAILVNESSDDEA